MPLPVVDRSSNTNDQIVQAAEVIGASAQRAAVFRAIYFGKKAAKGVAEIAKRTRLSNKAVLIAGKRLVDAHLVEQLGTVGSTTYKKVSFFTPHYRRILRLATNKKARERVPTKRRAPTGDRATKTIRLHLDVRVPKRKIQVRRVTIDDFDSFVKARRAEVGEAYTRIPEKKFKEGVAKILGDRRVDRDWGGERRDHRTSNLRYRGARKDAVFAFKGPGTPGPLTIGKMGKNGDQVLRLIRCPADVYFVQFWAGIDDAVIEHLEMFAQAKSLIEDREVLYGVIDGDDSNRLISGYPGAFPGWKVE